MSRDETLSGWFTSGLVCRGRVRTSLGLRTLHRPVSWDMAACESYATDTTAIGNRVLPEGIVLPNDLVLSGCYDGGGQKFTTKLRFNLSDQERRTLKP